LSFSLARFTMSGVARKGSRLLLNAILGLPLVVVAAIGGYVFDRWEGVVLGFLAIVSFQVVYRLGHRLRERGMGHAASALPIAALAAALGYATLGVFGLIFLGVLTWLPFWFGSRLGERMLRQEEAAREARLRRTHDRRQPGM
jgi:hypothetical protein